jgi:hypothetical protein
MTPALIFALSLMLTADPAAADGGGGEPLPPGAPTDSYELSAWCYGALDEYLAIYEKVKPDLKDIDRRFGTSVVEDEPYHEDMAAARRELKMIGESVTDAERASPRAIAERGAAAMRQGEAIWQLAEGKTTRELARAWMLWALPDRCDSNAKELTQRSLLLGKALNYNAGDSALPANGPPAETPAPAASDQAPATSPAAAAPDVSATLNGTSDTTSAPPASSETPAPADAAPPPATAPAPQP